MVRQLWDEIDLHIVLMLMFALPWLCLSWWWLALPLLIPQGLIYVRAFVDCPSFDRQSWAYLVATALGANE